MFLQRIQLFGCVVSICSRDLHFYGLTFLPQFCALNIIFSFFFAKRTFSLQTQIARVQNALLCIFLQFRNHYNVKQNNATQLVAKAAREIEKLLASRSKALEALATAAENLQKEHQWKDDLDFDINDTETRHNRVKLEFKEDPAFKRSVSYSTTAVHIPTDIYEGSTIILNELNWTAALDDVFKKNKEDDPSLLWQVFGSASGLARYFPASPWVDTKNTPNKIDLYDVRRRPWYIQVHTLTDTNPPSCSSREDRASEIFEEYNSEKKVRIFTFSVGQHNYDKTPIQWMACNNKGYYYEIPSIGAIRINTQEYLDVLGRPMVKEYKKAKSVQWTNVYVDALELGLVITGTLPVFNKTSTRKTNNNKPHLHVAVLKLGPNGYYFAIDPNGYVLLHPNLQPKVRLSLMPSLYDLKSQEPVTLDLLDAELEDEVKVEVRANFYDVLSYFIKTLSVILFLLQRYIDRGIRTYTWGPVHDTDYRSEQCFVLNVPFPCFRDYCTDLKAQSDNNTQFLTDFIEYIDIHTPNHSPCNMELINRLLLDAGITAELAKHWNKQGIRAKFVVTDGGVTRVYPASAGSEWTEQAETYKSSFYKRSLDNNIFVFTSSPYAFNGKYVLVIIKSSKIPFFLFGLMDIFCPLFIRNSRFYFSEQSDGPENCIYLFLSKNLDCFLLDDGGFLVMTNKDLYINKIGQFFGMIDPSLMRNLINESLFSVNITYDYQALCEPTKETKAAAGLRSVYVPTIADILTIGWWASAAACSWQLNINCVLFTADLDDDLSEMPSKESCIKEQKQYFFENDETTFKGTIDCQNCSRQFIAEKLPKTNLVLIVADTKEPCCQADERFFSQEEKPSPGPDPCEIAQNPRYRKGPTQCFENNASVSHLNASLLVSLSEHTYFLLWILSFYLQY
uniref:Calcium channel, voltage-dependent, alpha 2/delta subunit 1a n=1 Tax=Sinocyclocheilus anshuiensis TaxID=1608454 RepID=A0A671LDI3_9TELE